MKNFTLKVINPLLLLLVIFQVATAVLRGSLYEFFHTWHPIGGSLLVLVGLIHLALNWNWVKGSYSGKAKTPK